MKGRANAVINQYLIKLLGRKLFALAIQLGHERLDPAVHVVFFPVILHLCKMVAMIPKDAKGFDQSCHEWLLVSSSHFKGYYKEAREY